MKALFQVGNASLPSLSNEQQSILEGLQSVIAAVNSLSEKIIMASTIADQTTLPTTAADYPLTCDSLCEALPSCKASGQGSYCKIANSPSVCFSLYWKSDATGNHTVCRAGDADCPETSPVLCQAVSDSAILN